MEFIKKRIEAFKNYRARKGLDPVPGATAPGPEVDMWIERHRRWDLLAEKLQAIPRPSERVKRVLRRLPEEGLNTWTLNVARAHPQYLVAVLDNPNVLEGFYSAVVDHLLDFLHGEAIQERWIVDFLHSLNDRHFPLSRKQLDRFLAWEEVKSLSTMRKFRDYGRHWGEVVVSSPEATAEELRAVISISGRTADLMERLVNHPNVNKEVLLSALDQFPLSVEEALAGRTDLSGDREIQEALLAKGTWGIAGKLVGVLERDLLNKMLGGLLAHHDAFITAMDDDFWEGLASRREDIETEVLKGFLTHPLRAVRVKAALTTPIRDGESDRKWEEKVREYDEIGGTNRQLPDVWEEEDEEGDA